MDVIAPTPSSTPSSVLMFPGLETMFHVHRKECTPGSPDLLVLVFHWRLVRDGVLCVGIGEDKSRLEDNEDCFIICLWVEFS